MSTDDLVEASPCKLRNGNWGCKTAVPVKVGDTVQITTRANKQWKAQITQVVWTDEQVCICETASEGSSPAGPASKPAQAAGNQGRSAPTPPAGAKASQSARPSAPSADNADPRDGDPAFSNEAPPPVDNQPDDDLDAMADRAAQEQDEMDDWMSEIQELERGS